MNSKCYKVVFSEHLGILVAVGEHATSSGKAASGQGWRGEVAPPSVAILASDGFIGALRLSVASVVLACLTYANVQAQTARPVAASSALPTGAVVNSGSASISANGAQMAITQTTDKASLNWQSFNVGTAASVNIAQPSASSVLLNRVVGNDPSQILGKVTANGQVILLNPNGILFGKDGSVTASAFTASTFGLSDADFMNGYLKYNRNGSTASVVNQGTIEATPGGYVALIGASVSNEGTIRARQGNVVLAAAESASFQNNVGAPSANATVSVPLNSKVRLELTPAAVNAAVSNSGVITTEGGQVLISAAALSDAVAQIGARVTHSGVIDTSAPQAGAVTLLADNGTIKVDGSITANSNGPTNDKPKAGGDIIIGRNPVSGVLAKSTDVSGATLESQGGFVETSGEYLKTDGIKVKANEWLLDPTNITIAASGASGDAYAANYTAGQDSTILASDINASLNAGTSVTIATSTAGASAGTIAVNENISKTAGADANLTLKAHGNIFLVGKSITSTAGKLNVVMNSDWGGSGAGAIFLSTSGIDSNGGNVTLGGGTAGTGNGSAIGNVGTPHGIWMFLSNISSGVGNVTLTGTSHTSGSSAFGVLLESNSTITTTTGAVNITGTSQSSGQYGYGVNIRAGNSVTTGSGNITVNGTGSTSAAGDSIGVQIGAAGAFTTTSGNVSVTGTSRGTGGTNNMGVNFASGSIVAGNTGTVTITGTASAVGATSVGVNAATVTTTGASVNISGTASSGGASAFDITPNSISTSGGNITLTADSYSGSGTETVNAGTGSITLQNRTAGTLIDLGGSDLLTGNPKTLGISSAEFGRLNAANTKIGSTTSSDFTVSAALTTTTANGNVTLQSGGNVGGTNTIAIGGPSLTIDSASNGTLAGNISGPGNLAKAGAGTLFLTGNNTYSGTTTISAGTLQVGNGGTAGNLGSGRVSNNASLVFNRSDAISVANIIDGNGNLTQAGTGTTTFTGNLVYYGTTTISAGTMKNALTFVGTGPATTESAFTVANGATLDLAGNSYTINSIAGAGTVTNSGLTAATLNAGGDATSTTFSGVIQNGTGTLSLRKLGTGTLTLSGNNTYSGTTTLSTGTLKAGSSTAFSSNSALYISVAGTLDLAGNSNTIGSLAGGGTVTNSAITAATLTTGGDNTSTTFSGVLQNGTGTLSLTKVGSGTTTLTGTNTYLGTTTISAGTLKVGNGSTSGTLGRYGVVNNASLVFNRSDAISIDNDISGSGSLTQQGTGTLTLLGNDSYSGGTTISAGTLQVGNGGNFGSFGTGAVVNNASLVINLNVDLNVGFNVTNDISGTGSLTQLGAGATTLSGTNTYSGTTTISNGVLKVGNGWINGTLGSGAVVNNASLLFNRSNAISVSNDISGSGSLTQAGAAITTLSGNNTYSGTTTISGGTLKAGSTTAFSANSAVSISNGATLDLAGNLNEIGSLAGAGTVTNSGLSPARLTAGGDNTSTTFSGVIQNGTRAMSLTKTGAGTLILSGANSYTGTTTISAGTLQVGNGGTTGTLGSGLVIDNASLVFNRSNALSVANDISGTGRLTQLGTGTTTLTGNDSYSGGTTISAGTLQVGNGGNSGSFGTGEVVNNAELAINLNVDLNVGYNVTNTISGTGNLTLLGAGATTFSGNNSYSGTTTISNGVLKVGNGGNTGTLGTGSVVNNASLVFNRSNAISINNDISGTGGLTKIGAGTATLAGANTYSGTTTISNGTLQVGSGGTTGTLGTGSVVNNTSLVFARAVDTSIANSISGTGNVSANITSNGGTAGNLTINSSSFSLTGGTIDLRADGNITLSTPMATTNTTSSAVMVVAGQALAAGVSTGGNVIVNGTGGITVGTGGVATLFSGSVAGTTGISGMAASGSGKFRYNSDEITTNYTKALDSKSASNNGVNVIYREAPTLTLKVNDASKTYDGLAFSGGSFNATPTSGTLQNGDTVASVSGNATFAGTAQGKKNVSDSGTTITGSDTSGTNALGYAVSYTSGTLTVNKKDVSLSAITAANKTYDSDATATITSGSIVTGVGTEALSVSGYGTFNNRNAADGKTVTVTDVTALTKVNGTGTGISDWANYNLTTTGAMTTTANISKKNVSLTSMEANNKTYDGSNATYASALISTGAGGEALNIAGPATFSDPSANFGKTVTIADVSTLNKTDNTGSWSNYTLVTTGALTAIANIYKKDVSLTSLSAANKTYDGNTSATITSGSITTGVGTETLSVNGLGSFSDKNAGNGKTVTVTDVTALTKVNGNGLGGGDWANYNLTTTGAMTTTANIAKASLSVTAIPVTKTYDGTTSATGTATVGTLASTNDSINNAGIQTFLNKDVGTGKTVTASGVTIKDTANADMTGNYVITYVPNTSSVINKASLLVTANADTRYVTLADTAGYKGVTYSGLMGGETSAVLGGSLSISRTNALTDVAAGSYSGVLVPTGLTSSNYDIRYAAGNFTILPADRLRLTTTSQTVTYGTTPTFTTTAEYLDSQNNTFKVLTQTGTNNNYTFNDGAGTSISLNLKPYLGSNVAAQSTSGNTVVGSYEVKDLAYLQTGSNFNSLPVFIGSVTINPKAITPSTSVASKVYDGTASVNNVVVGMSGKVGNDLVSVSGTGTFTQKNVGTNLGYTVTGISLSSADAGNYYLSGGINQLSGINGVITPASLVLSTENISKIYDGKVDASGILKAVQGTRLFGTDTMRGGTFTFSSPAAGLNNKVVRVSDAIINDGNEGRNYSVSYMDNTQSSIISPVAPFVLPIWNTTDTVFPVTGGKSNKIFYEITMERNFTESIQENSEICKPLLSIDCYCISPENRDLEDGVNCGKDPKSVQIKYTKTPRS